MKKQLVIVSLITGPLLWAVIIIILTIHHRTRPTDAGCQTEFGNKIECPDLDRQTRGPE